MKCRVLKTLAQYDSAIKDALAWIAWGAVYGAVRCILQVKIEEVK